MMDDIDLNGAVAAIGAAIGEPARARMLYGLADGRARTSTELAIMANVMPSTASTHLQRLKAQRLVKVVAQGKHRYYTLDRPDVGAALEALGVLVGSPDRRIVVATPQRLRAARTCYDHIAGSLGFRLYDRYVSLGWLTAGVCDLTSSGRAAFEALGIDMDATRGVRRRFAFPCLDWSERRPHLGGALGAAMLRVALRKRWVVQDLDSRILRITTLGRRELATRVGISPVDVG